MDEAYRRVLSCRGELQLGLLENAESTPFFALTPEACTTPLLSLNSNVDDLEEASMSLAPIAYPVAASASRNNVRRISRQKLTVKTARHNSNAKFLTELHTRVTKFGFESTIGCEAPPQSGFGWFPALGALWKKESFPLLNSGANGSAANSAFVDNGHLPGNVRQSMALRNLKKRMLFHGNSSSLFLDLLSNLKR